MLLVQISHIVILDRQTRKLSDCNIQNLKQLHWPGVNILIFSVLNQRSFIFRKCYSDKFENHHQFLYTNKYIVLSLQIISNHHHHHHLVVPLARISLTLSCHFSLQFIASGRSSGLHPVFSHSFCMYVRAGHPVLCGHMWGSIGVHRL